MACSESFPADPPGNPVGMGRSGDGGNRTHGTFPAPLSNAAQDEARLRWHLDRADELFVAGRDDEARDVLADAVTFLPPIEKDAA